MSTEIVFITIQHSWVIKKVFATIQHAWVLKKVIIVFIIHCASVMPWLAYHAKLFTCYTERLSQ